MATCDAEEFLDLAKCFGCLDDRSSMMVFLRLLCDILQELNPMATCDVEDLIGRSRCFACLDTKGAMMVGLQLACEILSAGGGGVCNRCEEFDPNEDAACDCAHWTNTATGEMWYWRALTGTWVKYISNT